MRPRFIRKNSDAPRRNERLKVPRAGYVVSYLQASRERGGSKAARKGLCVNNYCTDGHQVRIDQESSPNGLERAKEFEKGFLLGWFKLFEFLGGMFRFAMVAEDGVEKRNGSAVVHETRVQADAPERSGADFVGSVVEFGDGEVFPGNLIHVFAVMLGHGLDDAVACADIVEKEVAVGMKLLVAQRRGNRKSTAVDLCAGGGGHERLDVANIAAHFVE